MEMNVVNALTAVFAYVCDNSVAGVKTFCLCDLRDTLENVRYYSGIVS